MAWQVIFSNDSNLGEIFDPLRLYACLSLRILTIDKHESSKISYLFEDFFKSMLSHLF